jgi:S1-C subfamily serine protease
VTAITDASTGSIQNKGLEVGDPHRFSSIADAVNYCGLTGAFRSSESTVQGSGFIVAQDQIVTNHHVVAGSAEALLYFRTVRPQT